MSKFNNVAQTHMNQYLEMIQPDGKLPNSAQIEDSYVRALEKHGLSAKTAIDVVGAIDNSKKEAKDLIYCFHATIPNLCHVPKHAYK